jgi:hypothetical protein
MAGGGTTGADEATAPPRFETGFALALETGLADEEVALVEMGLAFEAGLADFDGGAEADRLVRNDSFLYGLTTHIWEACCAECVCDVVRCSLTLLLIQT